MKSFLINFAVLALGISLGMAIMIRIQPAPACPQCPDVVCPDAVSLNLNRQDLGELQKLKIKKSTIDQRIVIDGQITLNVVDCAGKTRSVESDQTGIPLDTLIKLLNPAPAP